MPTDRQTEENTDNTPKHWSRAAIVVVLLYL